HGSIFVVASAICLGAAALFAMTPIVQVRLAQNAGDAATIAFALNGSMIFLGQGLGGRDRRSRRGQCPASVRVLRWSIRCHLGLFRRAAATSCCASKITLRRLGRHFGSTSERASLMKIE
ncbi:MAG: hypothetical protein AAGI88_23195, partial [Pseudomonadota bacterium]